ncbi:LOW QUALITY PROTEIN: hypothetical protein HID58_058957, partial [Brassica napus]
LARGFLWPTLVVSSPKRLLQRNSDSRHRLAATVFPSINEDLSVSLYFNCKLFKFVVHVLSIGNGSSLLLGDLKAGCCSSTVVVRLMRFWEARNVKKANKLMVLICSSSNKEIFQGTKT